MVNSNDFKTKTIFYQRDNVSVGNAWIIALDIGYSSVKAISNNSDTIFPSYARKIESQILSLGGANSTDIQYRNNITGELWAVGAAAQDMIIAGEAKESISELYGRNRYYSDMFKVISETGMGVSMMNNMYSSPENKDLFLQTGLPPAYLKSDSEMLTDVLSGNHNFSLKVGSKPWVDFNFTLQSENIFIMPQPMGTLFSIATDKAGKYIADASSYFKSSMLIFDSGFGTLDIFNIRNRMIESYETFDNLGMKRVLSETTNLIMDKFHEEIPVQAMQKYLASGTIKHLDRKKRSATKEPFGDLLEISNNKVCEEALKKIDTIYNGLFDYDYLVITGGTSSAWANIIKEWYSGMETLKIIDGSQNDTLPSVFANVRGYYMYLINKLRKIEKSKQ